MKELVLLISISTLVAAGPHAKASSEDDIPRRSPCTASRRDGGDSLPHRLITGPRVIGPVARDLNDATRNLIQQGRQQTTVVDPARCNLHRHHLFRPLIDTQVQLTPGSAPTMSMLSDVPFTRAVHSQARRIHNHVPRLFQWRSIAKVPVNA